MGFCPSDCPLKSWDDLWLTGDRSGCFAGPATAAATPRMNGVPVKHAPPRTDEETAMNAQELLQEISDYCRHTGLAESTFGRRAVNDGKLANRLRNGGRITPEPPARLRASRPSTRPPQAAGRPAIIGRPAEPRPLRPAPPPASAPANGDRDPQRNFRFFDNRQKYLLFVNTCSEKWVTAH